MMKHIAVFLEVVIAIQEAHELSWNYIIRSILPLDFTKFSQLKMSIFLKENLIFLAFCQDLVEV